MKIRRVVVGVDFREPSVAAARWTAREFAPDADVVLVHVVDLPMPPGFLRGAMAPVDRVAGSAAAGARARLSELGPWVDGERVVPEVVVGHVADRLVEAVDTHAADLLVIGEHHPRGRPWEVLGTTAEKVVRDAAVPLLVARGLPPGPPARILAAVDDSSGGRRALRWAAFLGRHLGARVVAFHAVEAVAAAPIELVGILPVDEITEDLREESRRWLAEEAREAGAHTDLAACEVAVGAPAEQILAAAERERADLLVIGSRGVPGPVSGVLGGTARAVLREATGSVLVVGPLGR